MQHSAQQQADCTTPKTRVNFNFTDHILKAEQWKGGEMQRRKLKMTYGCQIKMVKKSDEEIRINQKKVIYGAY